MKLDYLFLDASFFRMHPARRAEPVLAACGITTDGKPASIGLAPGTGESFDAWQDFLADLRDRGLPSPLPIISDGAAGPIGAIERVYPKALRQRCLAPISSSAPSAKPAEGSRSSAGSPAKPAASPWCGPSWNGPPAAGAASP
jgi:transposase-like protein